MGVLARIFAVRFEVEAELVHIAKEEAQGAPGILTQLLVR